MKGLSLVFCTVLLPLSAFSGELVVSAAASLTNAFSEIGAAYEKTAPDTKVIFNFGSSGQLLQQIEKGAPVDIFASADLATMDKAEAGGFVEKSTRAIIAKNTLVLAAPVNGETNISGLADLSGDKVKRVAIGDPGFVPAGKYAKQSLSSAGLWEALQPKLILGANVRQVLEYVSRGEVDAGIVFVTDAMIAKDTVKMVATLSGHDLIAYPIAVVAGGKNITEAKGFANFAQGAEGRGILRKYGFEFP